MQLRFSRLGGRRQWEDDGLRTVVRVLTDGKRVAYGDVCGGGFRIVLCEVCCSLALRFGVPSVGFRCVPSSKLRCPQFEIPVSPVRGFCVSRVQGLCVSSLRFPCLQFEFPACLPFKVRLSPA